MSGIHEKTAAKQGNPDNLKKVTKELIKEMDLSSVTTRDFKQEYRSIEATLRENFRILAETVDTDQSLKPYLIVALKALSQISADFSCITKENVK